MSVQLSITKPWGKTARDDSGAWHSLPAHCIDVAAAGRALMAVKTVGRAFEHACGHRFSDIHLDRLAVIVGLHDVGKNLRGFQDKIASISPPISNSHLPEVLAVLLAENHPLSDQARAAVQLDMLRTWASDADALLLASICHHGSPVEKAAIDKCLSEISQQLERTAFEHEPLVEIKNLMDTLLEAYPRAQDKETPILVTREFEHLFAGVAQAADWMGSDATRFYYTSGLDDGRAQDAARIAQTLLTDTAFTGWQHRVGDILDGNAPRPTQAAAETVPLDRLAFIEDETGSGKTEAALIWARRLADKGEIDGIAFCVPTRSAAVELHARISEIAGRVWPATKGRVVRAVPGLIETDYTDPFDLRGPTWAAAPKRTFAAPVVVGTIDQAMLSHMRARHAWLRAALLSRSVLIIDEVHASDAYMGQIVTSLVERHIRLGSYVLCLSATLGETLRARLQGRRPRTLVEALRVPYPAITTGTTTNTVKAGGEREVAIHMVGLPDAEAQALEAAQAGAAVLWVRSTVGDAVADYQRFSQAGVEALLHHGRWADHDRRVLDQRVLSVIGKNGQRRGCIIVGTQTLEQSLDIDADLLVTDACPADVLLQRMGRCHRHQRPRPPGYEAPHVWIIDPGVLERYLKDDGNQHGISGQGWGWVYSPLIVAATLQQLQQRPVVRLPNDARMLVEMTTHPEALEEVAKSLGSRMEAHWRIWQGTAVAHRQQAAAYLIDWSRSYMDAVVTRTPPTRLGDPSVSVEVDLCSPLDGSKIDVLPVPARWLRGVPQDAEAVCRDQMVDVDGVRMEYGTHGLMRA